MERYKEKTCDKIELGMGKSKEETEKTEREIDNGNNVNLSPTQPK
jgi:hypothetical protein